ncbi:MAG: YceI family protein [Terriglobales bacterium]
MRRRYVIATIVLTFVVGPLVSAQTRSIDVTRSRMTVHAFKSGLFSAFGHDHVIQAPIEQGQVRTQEPAAIEFVIDSRRLKVLDPDLPANKRAEVQRTMHSADVLDSERLPEIRFSSGSVEQAGADRWKVRGLLVVRGRASEVVADVAEQNGAYRGSAKIKQRDFGIKPVSVAGGTIKVKDELLIEFEIALVTTETVTAHKAER